MLYSAYIFREKKRLYLLMIKKYLMMCVLLFI